MTPTDDHPAADFSALFQRHYRDVERFLLRRAPDVPVADLVAEVFLVAWRRWDQVPRRHALPWLYGVARHVLANEVRGRQRQRRLAERLARYRESVQESMPDDHADQLSDRLAVAAAFDALAERDREVLRLVVWERLKVAEAARVLGCSAPAFAMRLARARRRLRVELAGRTDVNRADAAGIAGVSVGTAVPGQSPHRPGHPVAESDSPLSSGGRQC